MFERYTAEARKSIFWARYEASQKGSRHIEPEHLLLGVLRDRSSMVDAIGSARVIKEIKDKLDQQTPLTGEKLSTSDDLPFSDLSKQILISAAQEADRLGHKRVTPLHLFLAILKAEETLPSKILREKGIHAELVEKTSQPQVAPTPKPNPTIKSQRDLVSESHLPEAPSFYPRQDVLDRIYQVLLRRRINSPLLVGEPGVGKDSLVRALAAKIAEGGVPSELQDLRILAVDLKAELDTLDALAASGDNILYVRGLFEAHSPLGWLLGRYLAEGRVRIISTCTPEEFDAAKSQTRWFEPIRVAPPSLEEAIQMVTHAALPLQKFHDVSISAEAIQTAVHASHGFPLGCLPASAVDLIDEAAATAKIRSDRQTPEIAKLRRRIRHLEAIAKHDSTAAKATSQAEFVAREQLRQATSPTTVQPEDMYEVLSTRYRLPVEAVKAKLHHASTWYSTLMDLGARVPADKRAWLQGLAAYLTTCTPEDAEKLAQAIRKIKLK
jgi:ATP-dependent Clp protease ATP-binding subunit ClpC